MQDTIQMLEELALNAFPSLQTELYDGWVLRFSNGYTYRGNSVNLLYAGQLPLDDKICYCETRFAADRLPTVFRLNDATPAGVEDTLAAHGYAAGKRADIMTAPIDALQLMQPTALVEIQPQFEDEWMSNFLRLNGLDDPKKARTAEAMFRAIHGDIFAASITLDGVMAGCGLGVLERGWVGLYDIRVDPAYRKRGLGESICSAILQAAGRSGAQHSYLQVASDNAPAIHLYTKMGYRQLYSFWYRVKEDTAK